MYMPIYVICYIQHSNKSCINNINNLQYKNKVISVTTRSTDISTATFRTTTICTTTTTTTASFNAAASATTTAFQHFELQLLLYS